MNYWWKNLIVTGKRVYNELGLKIFRNNRTFMTKSNKELLKVVFSLFILGVLSVPPAFADSRANAWYRTG
jgi:hypothetical protein